NLYKSFKAGMARIKLVGKILFNVALETILNSYGKRFNKEGYRRKKRVFRILCERVLHNSEVIPQKQKGYDFAHM
ncbi:PIPO, partial [Bean common mosaic virus]|uniref:PIPO n=1 Tax=Bean common mosaic virus TaxID=12196 RepID=UPI000264F5C4